MAELMNDDEVAEKPEERTFPDMQLAQKAFLLESSNDEALKAEVLSAVETDSMAPYYEILCAKYGWMVDDALLAKMNEANEIEKTSLTEKLKDAEENQGEMEVLDALFDIAQMYARIGAKQEAYGAYDVIINMPKVSSGKKIDASMHKLRVSLFFMDLETTRTLMIDAKKLVDNGGDWDRRNRLKAYEAVLLMVERDFKAAAALLLEGIATFTCTELCSYETFIYWAVTTNMLFLSRPNLKKKLVDGPEVLGVIGKLPPLAQMVQGLYECEYAGFFSSLVPLHATLLQDRYLARHARYLIREFRILAYAQFLNSYKSVMISSMAEAFGISTEFVDSELSRFIAGGRLNAKIDKVGGKVETNPPDERNSQYQGVIKKGDMLLTNIQKLARVIDA
jgi:26S proteasome regulatory subunit N7